MITLNLTPTEARFLDSLLSAANVQGLDNMRAAVSLSDKLRTSAGQNPASRPPPPDTDANGAAKPPT